MQERLDRMENMLSDLIKMVGKNNSMLVDLRSDVDTLKADVAVLKADVAVLKTDVAVLKTDVAVLKANMQKANSDIAELNRKQEIFKEELFAQSERIDTYHKSVLGKISEIELNANYAVNMVIKHDKELFAVKQKLAV